MELSRGPGCLLVFIDETGHEKLASGHTVYGLGGCAVLGDGLEIGIRKPWRQVRTIVKGNPDAPLHASEFSRSPTKEHIEAVASFFKLPLFFRLAAVATSRTTHPDEMEFLQAVRYVLGPRIQEIADRITLRSVAVVFEHNERARASMEKYFGDINIHKDSVSIPVDLCWMPKSANEPALEAADFVMHAVQGQMRRAESGGKGFGKDYRAVFMSVPSNLISFMQMASVVVGSPGKEQLLGFELR